MKKILFQRTQKTIIQKLCDLLKSIADAIKNIVNTGKLSAANKVGLEMQGERAMEIRSQFLKMLEDAKENIEQGKGTVEKSDIKYSIKSNIKKGMSDEERASILSNTPVIVPVVKPDITGFDAETVLFGNMQAVKKMFVKHFDALGIFKEYKIDDIDVQVMFSKNNMNESLHNAKKTSSDLVNMHKLFTVLDKVVETAKLIDIHDDIYTKDNENTNIKNVYVLVSGFYEKGLIPVELLVKEYNDGTKSSLYVALTINEIEAEVVKSPIGNKSEELNSRSASINLNVADIIEKVNPRDGEFLKYCPDPLLSEKQLISKREALAKREARIKEKRERREQKKFKQSLKDSDGTTLTPTQVEYFKESQIRDSKGNLKVMYHGSGASFTIFDKKKARSGGYYGSGFYFTESASHANQYGSNYKVYLNITNPMQEGTHNITKAQFKKFVEAVAENEDYGIDNYGYGATVDSVVNDVYGKDDFGIIVPTETVAIRYSLKDYPLDEEEYAQFMEQVGKKKKGEKFPKSRSGETIFTVKNKLVYSKGSYINPRITSVVIVEVEEDSEYENTYTSFIQEDLIKYETDRRYANISFEEYSRIRRHHYAEMLDREIVIRRDETPHNHSSRRNGLGGQTLLRNRLEYHFEDQQDGTGDNSESGRSAEEFKRHFSLKEDTIPENSKDFSQSDKYKAQVEALSSIFDITKGKQVDIF